MNRKNIKLDFIQLVGFSPGIVMGDKLKIANAINDSLSNLFDGDHVILPIPEDAPSDIPRIQLNSKDKQYSLYIAKSRLDFVFKYKEGKEEIHINNIFQKFLTIFQYFKEEIHTQITRCAIITNWIIKLERLPAAESLLSKYIRNEAPIDKPYGLELHCLDRELIAGFEVNKWLRIIATPKITELEQNSVTILIDINTLAERIYEFDKQSLQNFLEESNSIINKTIEKHLKYIIEK